MLDKLSVSESGSNESHLIERMSIKQVIDKLENRTPGDFVKVFPGQRTSRGCQNTRHIPGTGIQDGKVHCVRSGYA